MRAAIRATRPTLTHGRWNARLQTPGASGCRSLTQVMAPTSDDTSLVAFFDNPFSPVSSRGSSTGLLGHSHLTSPWALNALADGAMQRTTWLIERIMKAQESRDELYMVVKNLDKISDLLCGVIDLAELIRNAHPDPLWLEGANNVYEKLCGYMDVLNTHIGLHQALSSVFADKQVTDSLSQEAYYTAMVFIRDFDKSAIKLPLESRERFVSLSSEIMTLSQQFQREAAAARPPVPIPRSEVAGVIGSSKFRIPSRSGFGRDTVSIYPGSVQAQLIMQSPPSEAARKTLYVAAHSSTPEQIAVLERFLRARGELARVVGDYSYAHTTLKDKMAKSPEHVQSFLDALIARTRPMAMTEILEMAKRKQKRLGLPSLPKIQAWDRECYHVPDARHTPPLSMTVTPGTALMALSRLFRHLYGIYLRPADVGLGEVWHQDVRKLEVVDEDAGVIGYIYADLFARRGKAGGPAHYTIRCSRRTDLDDDANDQPQNEQLSESVQLSLDFDRAHRRRIHGQDGVQQLPIVVLLCDFSRSSMDWYSLQTLFHEMGHAMHSMIGRTEYHNVAGTRCATDFVELPSILMEHFLQSPSVLGLFHSSRKTRNDIEKLQQDHHYNALDTLGQLLLAVLDQAYHSSRALDPTFDTTAIWAHIQDTEGLIPSVPGTSWQTQFGHLNGYGATYYSYLFDRAIASRVWSDIFAMDPLSRESGEKYKKDILRYGGGRDPWSMISTLLGLPELEEGGADAMREVGRWGIQDSVAKNFND